MFKLKLKGQIESAIKDFDKAIELDPSLAEAYYDRGLAYSELNQYEKAIKDYDKAIELRENLPDKGVRVYSSLSRTIKKIKILKKQHLLSRLQVSYSSPLKTSKLP